MKKISSHYQPDIFDESAQRWTNLSAERRKDLVKLLSELLIQAIKSLSAIDKKEESNVSKNTAISFR